MKERKAAFKRRKSFVKPLEIYLAMILLISAIPGIPGCGRDGEPEPAPTDDSYHPQTDFQASWYVYGSNRIFTESEEAYYFIAYTGGQAFLYSAHKDTMEPQPLCQREGCLHGEEPDYHTRTLCDAFIEEGAQYAYIGFADGYLYLLSGLGNCSPLVRIHEKTGERTAMYWLDKVKGTNAAIHRGYLYTVTAHENNVNYSISQIWRHSLEKKESELLCEIPTSYSESNDLKAFGNSLFIRGLNPDELRQSVYYRLDLISGEQEMMPLPDGETDVELTSYQGEILCGTVPLAEQDRWNEASMTMYTFGSEWERIQQGQTGYLPFTADQDYFYQWNTLLGERPQLSDRTLFICDAQGEQVDSLSLDGLDLLSVYVGPGENVFLADIGLGESNTYYYFPKSEIGTGRITPRLFFKGDT